MNKVGSYVVEMAGFLKAKVWVVVCPIATTACGPKKAKVSVGGSLVLHATILIPHGTPYKLCCDSS